MPLRPSALTRLLGLVVLLLGLLSGCGGGGDKPNPPPPPPPKASPDASRSSVTVDRTAGIQADGMDRVTITITVRDGTGAPLAGETVSVEVSGAGNTVTQPVGKTNASGVATASVVSTQPGVKQVTGLVAMEDGALVLDEHPSIEFVNPPAPQLVLTAPPGPYEAGQGFTVEVVARDPAGNDATGYRGTVRFTSPDPAAELPADYTFTMGDNGRRSFNVVLKTAASPQQLTVTDTTLATLMGTLGREVVPGAPTQLRFVTQPVNGRVRTALPPVQVELIDGLGNRSRVSSPTVVVSLKGGNPASLLSGTVAVEPVDGLATFAELFLDQEGGGFQLTAGASALPAVDSNGFDVIDDLAPGTVTLTSTAQSSLSITLEWTAVGDDGSQGTAAAYELRYSTQPITRRAEFDAATLATAGTPQAPGGRELFTLEGLNAATTYYFAVVVRDSVGNVGLPEDLEAATLNPCANVVCEVPEPTCAVDGVTRVTFASACVLRDNLPTCQDTETRRACPGAEGVCFAGVCGTASGPAAGELTVTEVMHSPSTGTTQYIELQNSSQKVLNIAGVQVDYSLGGTSAGGFTVSTGPGRAVLIPAGGLFVLGSTEDFATNGGVAVDYAYGSALELSTEGRLIFRTASGAPLEELTWSFSFPQRPGSAMNLAAPVVGTWARQQAWYWCDSSTNVRLLGGDYGTPGQPNETCDIAVGPAPTFCNIQYPKTFPAPNDPNYPAIIPYGARRTIYSQLSSPGLTDRNLSGNDNYPHMQVELGYGTSVDPSGWQWSSARYNPFYDSTSPAYDALKDEVWGWLRIFTPGTYAYGFRYRLYDPVVGAFSGYTYCDQNGVAGDPATGSYGSVTVSTEPLGPAEHIVFSEFASRGTSGGVVSDTNEFIELYNPTSVAVDISGWKLQYMAADGPTYQYRDIATVPAGTSIAAKSYYLIAHEDYAGGPAPDLQYSESTPHLGGHLRLGLDTLGSATIDPAMVDKFAWGPAFSPDGEAAPVVASPAGSLERKAGVMATAASMEGGADAVLGNGSDTDWNADDFVIRMAREPQNSASSPEPL